MLQEDIDTLVDHVEELGDPEPEPVVTPPDRSASIAQLSRDPALARILRLHVPVIVQLAERRMAVSTIRDLSIGAIIEFEKAVTDPLDLLINRHLIGRGFTVKVGENFGLRVSEVCDRSQRVRSMGE